MNDAICDFSTLPFSTADTWLPFTFSFDNNSAIGAQHSSEHAVPHLAGNATAMPAPVLATPLTAPVLPTLVVPTKVSPVTGRAAAASKSRASPARAGSPVKPATPSTINTRKHGRSTPRKASPAAGEDDTYIYTFDDVKRPSKRSAVDTSDSDASDDVTSGSQCASPVSPPRVGRRSNGASKDDGAKRFLQAHKTLKGKAAVKLLRDLKDVSSVAPRHNPAAICRDVCDAGTTVKLILRKWAMTSIHAHIVTDTFDRQTRYLLTFARDALVAAGVPLPPAKGFENKTEAKEFLVRKVLGLSSEDVTVIAENQFTVERAFNILSRIAQVDGGDFRVVVPSSTLV